MSNAPTNLQPVATTEGLSLSDTVRAAVPVVLAPMAGITNVAFRSLCRGWGPDGLFVSEMITSRALVERNEKTMRLIRFGPGEDPRSLQLYGVDPVVIGAAVRLLVADDRADHIDLNFGCPVPKVTRKGGGAALPWHLDLFTEIVTAAVRAADGAVPVTVKMRLGVDREHLTYREAALRAQDAGVSYVALHGRTAADFYGGQADWAPIAELAALLDIPVLGNGDIWSAEDALRMVDETGCDGVVVGRGCLGRPWLFGDLAAAFRGESLKAQPSLGEAAAAYRRHAELLIEFFDDEGRACRDLRKHVAWYFKGYSVGGEIRAALATSSNLDEIDAILTRLDLDQPYPGADAEGQRGRAGTPKQPTRPYGWLDSRELNETHRAEVAEAELHHSGG